MTNIRRRQVLQYVACSLCACAAGSFLIYHTMPSAPPADPVDVPLAPIPEGAGITVFWKGLPIFIRHRTAAEIKNAAQGSHGALLDPQPDHERAPVPQWIVVIGVCSHLGCIPTGNGPQEPRGQFGGWICPCHGAEYDTSGRIRTGPAPTNLEVPPYIFLDSQTIRIGPLDGHLAP